MVARGARVCAEVRLGAKRAPRCAIEYSEQDEFTWMRWELKLRGKSRTTGDPVYAYEWVPHKGTRVGFMKELEANHNDFMPHVEAVREDRQVKKLIEERLGPEQGRHRDEGQVGLLLWLRDRSPIQLDVRGQRDAQDARVRFGLQAEVRAARGAQARQA